MSDEIRIVCVLKTKTGGEFSRLDVRRSPVDPRLLYEVLDMFRISCDRADIHACEGTMTLAQGERRLVVTAPSLADAAGIVTARERIKAFLRGENETEGPPSHARVTATARASSPPPYASASMPRANALPPDGSPARPSRGAK